MGFQNILLSPPKRIGDIEIPAIFEEVHVDSLRMTEHPVEMGAAITDHAYLQPREVLIRCGWSNATLQNFVSAIRSLSSELFSSSASASAVASDFVSSVYDKLRALMERRTPLYIFTGTCQYSNMLIVGLHVTRDSSTGHTLVAEIRCRQLIIVETRATTLPSKNNQARPASTASVENTGVKQLIKSTPMQGGAVANEDM